MHSVAKPTENNKPAAAESQASVLRYVLKPLFDIAEQFPDAEELVVNRPGEVMVELSGGVWERVMATGLTFTALQSMALAVAKYSAQSFSETMPVLFGTLPTGERLTFVGPPICATQVISLTMRLVKNKERNLTAYDGSDFFDKFTWVEADRLPSDQVDPSHRHLDQLLRQRQLRDFLLEAVQSKLTIGIVGDTGSGKTFLMECLVQCIPTQERLITVESARELLLPKHPNKVQLLYSHFGTGASALDAAGLMAVTKRMKPKRVLLGECIGPEAFVFLNMVVSGHPGSITSWHAKSIAVARERFVLMCREHGDAKLHTPLDLRELFDLTVDVLVQIKVDEPKPGQDATKKHRYVSDVSYRPLKLA